ncbi:MAG: hypothetical protein HC768_23130 [Acaryochloris sp. CRU_2_0]|nr:hypothetical protein [Acaryochloris sp. CRU_2_0]
MHREILNEGDVNTIMGTNVLFGGVNPLVLLAGVILFFAMSPLIVKNIFVGIPLFMLGFILLFLFLGNDPQRKLQRRTAPKHYRSGHPTLEYDRAGLPQMKLPQVKTKYNSLKLNSASLRPLAKWRMTVRISGSTCCIEAKEN